MPPYRPPIAEPPIVKTPPGGFFNVIRPPPPSFPGELTPQWVAVELPPSLMNQIMEQVGPGVLGVTMTPEMFKDIWEMTHFGPWALPSPTGLPPIEHGPVGGGGSTTPPREHPIPIPPPGPIRAPPAPPTANPPRPPIELPTPIWETPNPEPWEFWNPTPPLIRGRRIPTPIPL